MLLYFFFFSSRRRHTRCLSNWSSDVCSSDLKVEADGKDLGSLGGRASPFEGKPWSVYLPEGSKWSVTAETDLELRSEERRVGKESKSGQILADSEEQHGE